nr:NADH dehydrogenase subunit 6 [Epicypta sp. WQY003]
MLQFILNFIIIITGMIFSQMFHPLSMGLILLIQTLLISISIGLMSNTFWFSYILFLVFLGGMLVMFIYVTSLSSNEMFYLSKNMIIVTYIMLSLMFIVFFIDFNYIYSMFNLEMKYLFNMNIFLNENILMLNKLYNYSTNFMTFFLINYLFLTLVVCVKITNFFYGPLRPSF